jgi:hypothetical protein
MKRRRIGDLVSTAPDVFCIVLDVIEQFRHDYDGTKWYTTLVLLTPSGHMVAGTCDNEYVKDV